MPYNIYRILGFFAFATLAASCSHNEPQSDREQTIETKPVSVLVNLRADGVPDPAVHNADDTFTRLLLCVVDENGLVESSKYIEDLPASERKNILLQIKPGKKRIVALARSEGHSPALRPLFPPSATYIDPAGYGGKLPDNYTSFSQITETIMRSRLHLQTDPTFPPAMIYTGASALQTFVWTNGQQPVISIALMRQLARLDFRIRWSPAVQEAKNPAVTKLVIHGLGNYTNLVVPQSPDGFTAADYNNYRLPTAAEASFISGKTTEPESDVLRKTQSITRTFQPTGTGSLAITQTAPANPQLSYYTTPVFPARWGIPAGELTQHPRIEVTFRYDGTDRTYYANLFPDGAPDDLKPNTVYNVNLYVDTKDPRGLQLSITIGPWVNIPIDVPSFN